jgi:predicted ATPase with chaperone activity
MEEPSNQVAALLSQKINRAGQTKKIREKVITARQKALLRRSICEVDINRDIPVQHMTACFLLPETEALSLVTKVIPKHVSARSLIRCLRVARTIADIRARDVVTSEDLEQAWAWQSWSAAKLRGEVLPI